MKKYILGHCLLSFNGEFETDEQAIEILGDKFLRSRPVTPPGEHFLEKLVKGSEGMVTTNFNRGDDISNYGRCVFLQREEELYGIKQYVTIKELTLKPTKPEHWASENQSHVIQLV